MQPLATVLIGASAAALAFRQWLTANEKLRLDLYEPRSAHAENIKQGIVRLIEDGPDQFDALAYAGVVSRAKPLFAGRPAAALLAKLEDRSLDLWRATHKVRRLKPDDPKLDAFQDEVERLVDEVKSAWEASWKALQPYLTFSARAHGPFG